MKESWEMSTIERKYSVPPGSGPIPSTPPLQSARGERGSTSEDLHAWSIYRQNLNSDFTDSALGSSEKSPLPYGNFQLRESTVHSIINHPRYGPKSALSSNMYTYLKFGLPRVFPPSGRGRDGSSGYNSSDDGSPGPMKHRPPGPMRARSELDFRNLNTHSSYHKTQPHRANGRISNSEANLLSAGYPQEMPRTRRSVAGPEIRGYRPDMRDVRGTEHRKSFHDLRSAAVHEATFNRPISERRRSKAGSHLSLNQSKMQDLHRERAHSVMGHVNPVAVPYYPAHHVHVHTVEPGTYPYPHLQVRNLRISSSNNKDRLVVDGATFEVRGGELLAVMTTQAEEGSILLSALTSDNNVSYGKVSGEFVLNGNLIERSQLKKRCAFVRNECHWDEDLTVRQTLYFQHRLRHVRRKVVTMPLDDRIANLVGDLGLDQVSGTKLSGLTQSELRRLSVAIHLLVDVQILVLDQPTKGMDIFDTFFLIEYLRQWALTSELSDMSGRAVIVTLQPPTYEILTMISRVLIFSNGHVMYSGTTPLLLPYFTSVEYPCPPYKNPSDYYLDLVTLDDLSAEAMLESSQRMTQLGDLHKRRQASLSEPGPPAPLPPPLRYSNPLQQIFTLLLRNAIWSQPSSFIRYLFHILIAAIISFIIGAIFWDVPGSDTQLLLEDRLGFHHTVLCLALWPLILLTAVSAVRREQKFVLSEVRQGLYSPPIYVFTTVLSSLPGSLIMWLSYLVPSYIMSRLHLHGSDSESNISFYSYTGLCLLYLHAFQLLGQALTWLARRVSTALLLIAIVFQFFFLMSGHVIHLQDLPATPGVGLHMSSPTWWLNSALLHRELDKEAFRAQNHVCKSKQKEIIVQVACAKPNGTAELEYLSMTSSRMGLLPTQIQETALALAIFWLAAFILLLICFSIAAARRNVKRRPQRTTNKP